MVNTVNIIEEKNIYDDNLLDILGAEFRFNHEKGIAEWIKNAADAYIRHGVPDRAQFVILRFRDTNEPTTIECIDFMGMTSDDIQNAFKRWGDPEAAKRGLKKKVYGGHGNGGKFYMRQMFKESYFITYKNGKLNIYGFSPNQKYGFASGMKDVSISPAEALKIAEIENCIPQKAKEMILKHFTGFTVVRGIGPSGMKNTIKVNHICKNLTHHPQARKILSKIPVSVIYNNELNRDKLEPPEIKPRSDFAEPIRIKIPEILFYEDDGEKIPVNFTNDSYADSGELILRTSESALLNGSALGDLNGIDIVGEEMGSIGSYRILDLRVKNTVQAVFIYGECTCPILEDKENCCVRNDREKLIENERTKALLSWIARQIDELTDKMASKEAKEQENIQKKLSSKYNDFLNAWKNKFMSKLFSEVLTGTKGNAGKNGENWNKFFDTNNEPHQKHEKKNNDGPQGNGSSGDEGDKQKARERKYPEVKLSSHDVDPLNPPALLHLPPRQPLIYQRPEDVSANLFWINTSSPIAKYIIDTYGAKSLRWRDFLFQRYIDIFIKQALDLLAKKDPENFTLVGVDNAIDEIISRMHNEASVELVGFLFDESYEPIE